MNFWQRAQSLSFHTLPYYPDLLPLDLFLLPVLKLVLKGRRFNDITMNEAKLPDACA